MTNQVVDQLNINETIEKLLQDNFRIHYIRGLQEAKEAIDKLIAEATVSLNRGI